MRDNYKNLSDGSALADVIGWAIDVTRTRRFDLEDYDNQIRRNPVIFDVPASSADLKGTEKAGDMAMDNNFLYLVVDNGGTLEWRRSLMATF